jgi:hypothetical protein
MRNFIAVSNSNLAGVDSSRINIHPETTDGSIVTRVA